tara:strand:- start:327 stop:428 length:102 start_codon:yes stop_codon:yes gene_type:complete
MILLFVMLVIAKLRWFLGIGIMSYLFLALTGVI